MKLIDHPHNVVRLINYIRRQPEGITMDDFYETARQLSVTRKLARDIIEQDPRITTSNTQRNKKYVIQLF